MRAGFFLLGAYLPAALLWLSIRPKVQSLHPPTGRALAELTLGYSLAVGMGGAIGLCVLAILRRHGLLGRHWAAETVVAAIGYLLALSAVP